MKGTNLALDALILAFLFAGGGEALATGHPNEDYEGPNVILIVVDSLRADMLGAYNDRSNITPNIDRISRGGVVFKNMVAQGSTTINSGPSISFSLYPSEHNYYNYSMVVSGEYSSMAEFLGQLGYETFGFSANPHIMSVNMVGRR